MPDLPPSLGAALRPVLPELARDTVAAIGREVPDYARSLEGAFGQGLRTGVQLALERFVDELGGAGAHEDPAREVYVGLGRGELRAGRSLDALLSAYRLGARLAWERFQAAAVAAGHPPEVLYALAGAIFSYIDAISAESVAGYAEEQSRSAGERARRRRAIARLLGAEGADPEELAALALAAGWTLPARVAALAVADGEEPERLASRLGPDVVAAAEDGVTVAWIGDPEAPGRRAQLDAALRGAPATLGPAGPPGRGPRSAQRARAALTALQAGRLPDGSGARGRRRAPPRAPAPRGRGGGRPRRPAPGPARRAWRRCARSGHRDPPRLAGPPGQVQRVGGVLGVHPQTVRYRLAGLRDLLGEQLEDPDARFALALALRVRGEPAGTP